MRGARKKISNGCLVAAVQLMENRRLLSVSTTVAAGWEAQPANTYFDNYFFTPTVYNNTLYYGAGSANPVGNTPTAIEKAYGVYDTTNQKPGIPFGTTDLTGSGQTIAIIDAYDDPNAQSDINAFDAYYGLPSVVVNKLNDQGQTSPLPSATLDSVNGTPQYTPWQFEETLDIEWAHAMAPAANIDLFEASNDAQDLFNTVAAAASTTGVTVIDMPWTGPEFSSETAMDSVFTTPSGHAPITFITASGDHGEYGDLSADSAFSSTVSAVYPASSPNVVAVGGTSLVITSDGTFVSESAWGNGTSSYADEGSGGGISKYEAQPTYQSEYSPADTSLNTPSTYSTTNRVYPDVAMDADPNDGVAIYDSYDFSNNGSSTNNWAPTPVGGTGLSAALMAGLMADADQARAINGLASLDGPTQTLPYLYEVPITDYRDITSGSTGSAPFTAAPGYDLTSGLGAPIGNLLDIDLAHGPELTGTIFIDTNANGILNNGETGLAGITVQILGDTSDAAVTKLVSGTDGTYGFFVTDGTYTIEVTRPTGYYFTTPNSAGSNSSNLWESATITITNSGAQVQNVGLLPTSITFSGIVWNDSDTTGTNYLPNGIYDQGEFGVGGATVTLYTRDGTEVDLPNNQNPQTTNNGGQYQFTSLDPGSYYIIVTPPKGYLLTQNVAPSGNITPAQVSSVSQLGNGTQAIGQSPTVTLANGQNISNENIGVYQPRVFIQQNEKSVAGTTPGGTTQMEFPLELFIFPGQVLNQLVSIDYSTQDESAVAGTDYEQTTGSVEVDPSLANSTGEYLPQGQPTIVLLNSSVLSPNKVFDLNLSSDEADIVDPQVTGTIVSGVADNITVDTSKANVTETPSGVVAYFTIQLATPVDQPVTVDYTIGATGDTALGATPAEIEASTIKLGDVDYLLSNNYTVSGNTFSSSITLEAGATTATIPVLVLDNFAAGSGLTVSNPLSKTMSITLTGVSTTSQTTLSLPSSKSTATITNDPVENLNVTGTGTTYTDNSGNRVSVTLTGPGSAVVQRRGGENSDGIRIVLSGTTSASTLRITSTGQTSINEIDDDSPLGAIVAPKVNLTGSMSLQGGLSKLMLNSTTPVNVTTAPGVTLAPGVQITIGGGPLGSVITLKANVGRVTDTTFDLGIPISTMTATSINNVEGEPDQIFTPSIGTLKVAGSFDENIQTNTIGKLTVAGTIENSSIRAAVSIGPVVAASLINSQIFAGVAASTTSLPTSAAAFTAGTSIKSVKLNKKGGIFSNSSIAAATVGPLMLGNVVPQSGIADYGVAGLELLGVKGSTGTPFSVSRQTADIGTVYSDEDFLIRVYGV